jgi:hypothetical protein
LNIFERKVYRGILSPVYDNEKENWRILTNKEMTSLMVQWSEFLTTDHEVTGSIPGSTMGIFP